MCLGVDSGGLDRFKVFVYVASTSFDRRFCPSIYSETIVKQDSISYLLGVCCFQKKSHTNNRCLFAKSARTYMLSSSSYVSQIVLNTLRLRIVVDFNLWYVDLEIVDANGMDHLVSFHEDRLCVCFLFWIGKHRNTQLSNEIHCKAE